jgi:hypothetical protein
VEKPLMPERGNGRPKGIEGGERGKGKKEKTKS